MFVQLARLITTQQGYDAFKFTKPLHSEAETPTSSAARDPCAAYPTFKMNGFLTCSNSSHNHMHILFK